MSDIEFTCKFIQMTLYGEVAYHIVEPSKTMRLCVGVKKDFAKYIPRNHLSHSNGVADRKANTGYVFVDSCIGFSNLDPVNIWQGCWVCVHGLDEPIIQDNSLFLCELFHEPDIEMYIEEINRVSVHELIHLCEGPTINKKKKRSFDRWCGLCIDHKLHNFGCPDFKIKEKYRKDTT